MRFLKNYDGSAEMPNMIWFLARFSMRVIIEAGGVLWTVPELLFESEKLIPELRQVLINRSNDRILF